MAPTGFNADERAHERESGPVTIGGKTYHPRRLTNRRLRAVRKASREFQRHVRSSARESEEYKEELEIAREEGVEEKEAERRAMDAGMTSDAVDDLNTSSIKAQLPEVLVDDAGQPISEEAIEEALDQLDYRDIGELMQYLMGSPDPTETATPAS